MNIQTLSQSVSLLCDAILEMNINRSSKEIAKHVRGLLEGREVSPPASPMSILQTKDLDGLSRWHLQVSAPPGQSLRFELPQDFDPRLAQEPTGRFVLELIPHDFPVSPLPETQSGRPA